MTLRRTSKFGFDAIATVALLALAFLVPALAQGALSSPGTYTVDSTRDYIQIRENPSNLIGNMPEAITVTAPSGTTHVYEIPQGGNSYTLSLLPFHGEPSPGYWTISHHSPFAASIVVEVHLMDANGYDGARAGQTVGPDGVVERTDVVPLGYSRFVIWDEAADQWVIPPTVTGGSGVPNPVVPQSSYERPYVVVAVVDTGINPYHVAFKRPALTNHPSTYIDGYPGDSITLDLGQPISWPTLPSQKLHWFPGTNIIGAISFSSPDGPNKIKDDHGHGTGTSSNVVFVNPDVKLVMVETAGGTLESAVDWAASQSWIDVISISWGRLANLPFHGMEPYTKKAFDAGKIVVNSAGNEPTAGHTDDTNGPPWVLSIGGADRRAHGETVIASKLPDYLSNFTNQVALKDGTTGYGWMAGTSFAAPTVAGVASKVVLDVRTALGHDTGIVAGALVDVDGARITNRDVRGALNQTADYWTAAQFDATQQQPPAPQQPTDYNGWLFWSVTRTVPIGPTPWLQMGWGYVGVETVEPAVQVLLGTAPEPDPVRLAQKLLAKPFMEANYLARETYFDPPDANWCFWDPDPEPPCNAPRACPWDPFNPGECRPPE